MSVTQMVMAGPFKRLSNTFRRWWVGHKDNHFRIVSSLTILSLAATIWGIIFLFVLGGTTDDTKEIWVPWSWLGLIVGGTLAFWLVPEFLVYLSHKAALDEILLLDSRPEVLRRRKEAEEAADMLGPGYQAHLVRLYNDLGIKVGSRFRHISPAGESVTESILETSGELEEKVAEPWDEIALESDTNDSSKLFSTWWNTRNSRLSVLLPGAKILREVDANRAILGFASISATLLLYNMIFGLATQGGGPREFTVDLTLMLAGDTSIHSTAPHFDGVGSLLAATALTMVFLTRPTNQEKSSNVVNSNASTAIEEE
ncbi:MAG: hypothetical protein VYB30_06165 [Candidatus Thermoplasmatota archaeon]|nr:hypothetical protein [Candidatus Thermoplasmatota archaeon]